MSDHELPLAGRALDAKCRELAAVKAERDALLRAARALVMAELDGDFGERYDDAVNDLRALAANGAPC